MPAALSKTVDGSWEPGEEVKAPGEPAERKVVFDEKKFVVKGMDGNLPMASATPVNTLVEEDNDDS